MENEARFLKRKVKAGRLDVHPTDNAIVVNYEVEAVILTDMGEPMIADAKRCQKNIRVRSLNDDTDIHGLAQNIIDRCKLIAPQKLPELIKLLQYLQNRSQDEEFGEEKARLSAQHVLSLSVLPTPNANLALILVPPAATATASHKYAAASVATSKAKQGSLLDHNTEGEAAKIGQIDEYMEHLYEGLPEKIHGTALILQIAQNPDNLEEMIQNESVLGALARVLREDGLKPLEVEDGMQTMELATNIIHIFFILSSFTEFHDFLKQYKIGALCMKIMAQEMKRYEKWQSSLKRRLKKYAKKKPQEAQRAMDNFNDNCFKQESLLYVAVGLLLNLAEDTRVQIKMKNKNIVKDLITLLDRDNVEFLILIVKFLKKLSIFAENKDEMKEGEVTKKLVRLINSPHSILAYGTLGLLLNLSFDRDLRARIIELGLLPRLVEFLQQDQAPFQCVVSILYNLTIDELNRAAFAPTDCVPMLMEEVLRTEDSDHAMVEVLALFVNLAMDKDCAVSMCENGGLGAIINVSLDCNDALLMKIVRNISRHEGDMKHGFMDHIDALASSVVANPPDEVLVEMLGVFGNLTIPNFNFHQLVVEYDLLDFIMEQLLPAAADDDIVLQVITVIGTILSDEDCADQVARSGIVQNLMELLAARQEDDEMVLQIVFVFYKLLFYESSRKITMSHPKTITYLIDLMYDKNAEIKRVCNGALTIVMQFDEEWAVKIRDRRFEAHNEGWINAMQGDIVGDYGMDDPFADEYADDVYDANDLDGYSHADGGYGDYNDYGDELEEDELELDAGDYGDYSGDYGGRLGLRDEPHVMAGARY